MDSITPVAKLPAGAVAEPPVVGVITNMNPVIPTAPLDLDENDSPKVRTKLRLYAILAALYVGHPACPTNSPIRI